MWFTTKNKIIFFIPIMNGLYVIKMMGDWKKEGLSFWVRSKRFLLAVAAILIPFIVLAEIS